MPGIHPCQACVTLQLALRRLLLTTLQLHHLLPPLPPPSVTFPACSLDASPVCRLLCWTTVLFKVLWCKIKNALFFVFVFMYYWCEKYYKPITAQCYIAVCVSWVPRLTLLVLWAKWTYKCALGMELICTYLHFWVLATCRHCPTTYYDVII